MKAPIDGPCVIGLCDVGPVLSLLLAGTAMCINPVSRNKSSNLNQQACGGLFVLFQMHPSTATPNDVMLSPEANGSNEPHVNIVVSLSNEITRPLPPPAAPILASRNTP